MPSSFTSGIAQSQAQPKAPSNIDPSRPWEYTYRGEATKRTPYSAPNIDQYRGGYGGAQISDGPQGHGIYQFNSPEENMKRAQQYYAEQFRNNAGQLKNQMGHQLAEQSGQQMDQGIQNVRQNNARRGLLYGGIDQGQEQGVRSAARVGLAKGRSAINEGVDAQANSMDNQAIDFGVKVQQIQQQQQNLIYQQALAKMNGQNQMTSGLLGAAGMGLGMYLGSAAGPAGMMAGGQMGATAGGLIR